MFGALSVSINSTILLNKLDYAEMLEEEIFNNFCNLSFININSTLFIAIFFVYRNTGCISNGSPCTYIVKGLSLLLLI